MLGLGSQRKTSFWSELKRVMELGALTLYSPFFPHGVISILSEQDRVRQVGAERPMARLKQIDKVSGAERGTTEGERPETVDFGSSETMIRAVRIGGDSMMSGSNSRLLSCSSWVGTRLD